MAKVVLIRPPHVYPASQKRGNTGSPPLGLAYLAAAVKSRHDVQCIDAYGEALFQTATLDPPDLIIRGLTKEEIVARIPATPDFIGISCMFTNEWIYCRELIASLRKAFPGSLIVLGGEHASADPEFSLRDAPGLDLIAVGEGENTLLEILEALEGAKSYEDVPGLAIRRENSVLRTPVRARTKDISSLPWPAWELLPVENYLAAGAGQSFNGLRSIPMIASRGCPYKCTFCSNPVMWGNKWLVREVEDVILEIKKYISAYSANHIDFCDLTAILREDWIKIFCRRLIEENLPVTWSLPTGTRSEALSHEVLGLLKKSGCLKLHYAPESGSEATLKRIRKMVTLPKMIASMKESVRVGLLTRFNMIVGFPGQTRWEIFESYLFSLRLAVAGVQDIACYGFTPYPGSELHDQLVKEGKINKHDGSYIRLMAYNVTNNPNVIRSWNESFSRAEIRWIIWSMVGSFYFTQFLLRPWRLGISIARILGSKQRTTFEILVSTIATDIYLNLRHKLRAPTGDPI